MKKALFLLVLFVGLIVSVMAQDVVKPAKKTESKAKVASAVKSPQEKATKLPKSAT